MSAADPPAASRRRGMAGLAVLLACALALRVVGAWTDYPYCWYPDRDVVIHARNCINPRAPRLNPGEFIYPTGYIYLNALVYAVTGAAAVATGAVDGLKGLAELYYSRPGFLAAVTRVLGSLLSCLAIVLVWRLGRRLGGPLAGWLAAAALAFAGLDVVCCHYPTTDAPAALVLLAGSVWALGLYAGTPTRRHYLVGGLVAGAAAAVKYPAGATLVGMVLALLLAPRPSADPPDDAREGSPSPARHRPAVSRAAAVALLVAGAAAGFLLLCPWALLDWATFASDLLYQSVYNRTGPEAAWQVHRFFFGMTPVAGMGWPLNLLALGGLGWLALRRGREAAVVLSGPALVYLSFATTTRFLPRWYEMLMPFVALGVGLALARLAEAALRPGRTASLVAGLALAAMLARPVAHEVRYDRLLLRPGSRAAVTEWVRDRVPEGGKVALTQWLWAGPDLPEQRYALEWVLPGSPERLQAGLKLRAILDGPWGRRLARCCPGTYLRLRQRQAEWLAPGESLADLVPPLPADAEWVIVNLCYQQTAAAGAPRDFQPLLRRHQQELRSLLSRDYEPVFRAGTAADEHPWGLWPYGSPEVVVYHRRAAAAAGAKVPQAMAGSSAQRR